METIGENLLIIFSEGVIEAFPKCDRHFLWRLDDKFRNFVIKLHELSTGSLTDRYQSDQIGTYPKSKPHKLRLVKTTAGKRQQAGQIPWCNRERRRNFHLDSQDGALAVLIRRDQALTPYSFSESQFSKGDAAKGPPVSGVKTIALTNNHTPCPTGGHLKSQRRSNTPSWKNPASSLS
jgi:hypothetical protein